MEVVEKENGEDVEMESGEDGTIDVVVVPKIPN